MGRFDLLKNLLRVIPNPHLLRRFGQVRLEEVGVDLGGFAVLVVHQFLDDIEGHAGTSGVHGRH